MKKKGLLVPTIYLLALFAITIGLYFTRKVYDSYNMETNDNINYVSNSILNRSVPIINVSETIIKPYTNEKVEIKRNFYNSSDDDAIKENAIVYYNGTYMPNTGIDYTFSENFEVVSIIDGTVIDVSEDEFLGKTIQIRHNNEIVSVYQSLNNVNVQKGDVVLMGQKIGESGSNKINTDNYNLHFEIYKNGEVINPNNCIGKKLGDI